MILFMRYCYYLDWTKSRSLTLSHKWLCTYWVSSNVKMFLHTWVLGLYTNLLPTASQVEVQTFPWVAWSENTNTIPLNQSIRHLMSWHWLVPRANFKWQKSLLTLWSRFVCICKKDWTQSSIWQWISSEKMITD